MNDLTREVVKNSREWSSQMAQRKHAIVRVCGEEHSGSGTGEAQLWLTLDNDMAYISEMKFKLVFDTGVWEGDPTGSGSRPVVHGINTWPTIGDFLDAYPLGSYITANNGLGAQCYNYAWAFWWGQVNRNLSTCDGGNPNYCSGYACDLWRVAKARAINAGSEFELITDWTKLKRGDWVVWCNNAIGHIAMAKDSPTGNKIEAYGQNQPHGEPLVPVAEGGYAINVAEWENTGFVGAFRYKKWQ